MYLNFNLSSIAIYDYPLALSLPIHIAVMFIQGKGVMNTYWLEGLEDDEDIKSPMKEAPQQQPPVLAKSSEKKM